MSYEPAGGASAVLGIWMSLARYGVLVRPASAISELEGLLNEGTQDPLSFRAEEGRHVAWRAKVETVITRALGATHHTIEAFRNIQYYVGVYYEGMPDSVGVNAFRSGMKEACGYIEAAIYELRLLTDDDAPIDDRAFDSDLWAHVNGIVADEDWGKVASLVATFVEDRLRSWSGSPKDKNGDDLYGKGLYSAVFADDAEYRLGKRKGEWEGWRMLAIGFAQAIGNVDRHHVQDRADARRYALGVLGLGSLILTQMRYEHEDHFASGPSTE